MTFAGTRKADRVAAALLRRIVSGALPVGSLLPREDELADEFGVNRGAVREAIKQLEVHRLVAPVRKRGTVVLDPIGSLTPEVLRAMIVPDDSRVDGEMFASFLEVRAELDAQLCALAAERRTEADLRAIHAAVADLVASRAAPRRFSAAVEALAMALARSTHNPIFMMLVHWQRHIVGDLEDLFLLVRLPSDPYFQGLRALEDAIVRRDSDMARGITRAFHAFATPTLLAAVEQGPPVRPGDDAAPPSPRAPARPHAPRKPRAPTRTQRLRKPATRGRKR